MLLLLCLFWLCFSSPSTLSKFIFARLSTIPQWHYTRPLALHHLMRVTFFLVKLQCTQVLVRSRGVQCLRALVQCGGSSSIERRNLSLIIAPIIMFIDCS